MSFWEPVFNHLRRQPDSPLAQALTTPLAVWLVRAVFSGPDRDPTEPTDTSRFATPVMIEDYLLDVLIPTLINEGELAPHGMSDAAWRGTADDARRYLAFLAAHLSRLGSRDFAWWELHRALHPIVPRLVIGLAVGLFGGLLAEIVSGPHTGLLIGIAAGIISTFLSSSSASPPGYASFRKRNWKRLSRRRFAEQAAGGLLAGIALGLLAVYKGGQVPGPLGAVVTTSNARGFGTGLVAGLVGGAVLGVVEMLRTPAESDIPTSPSSTFSSDRRLTLIAGLVITVISGVIAGLFYGIVPGLLFGVAAGLATVVITGIGGAFVGRKLAVRAWPMFIITTTALSATKDTPRRLMRFLEDAYRLGILRRVGAVYQFRHTRLQDRLAATYQDRRQSPPANR